MLSNKERPSLPPILASRLSASRARREYLGAFHRDVAAVGSNYFDSHLCVPRKRKSNLCPGDKQLLVYRFPAAAAAAATASGKEKGEIKVLVEDDTVRGAPEIP